MLKKLVVITAAGVGVFGMTVSSANAATFNSTTTPAALAQCSNTTIVVGSVNKCVQRVQAALRQLVDGKLATDGHFGNQTWKANYTFESNMGMKHDGKVDNAEYRVMITELGRIQHQIRNS
jgi:peptidoglycan hydrolase-like protein with peptidoglycan-binding domain